ncbi:uncharacterized protein N7496_008923 [Penicillium cataractarum]|uniref:Uncharacterized protein n=1 Tax=Penicillium cataractarum TaxID=2100454 RepID=A0A9W9S3Y6_9EURO|nr:uncharacterized protein N7496_008923 [Penicillium cataractarum]KAJ5369163.1 hypothetical protein N7496_008923 [Penicillium cataractarum]
MEPTSSSACDSDPSLQTCVRCCLEKPIDDFVSRTKAKRPTKWCLACRYYGNERWAASKKLRLETEKDPESQEKVSSGQSVSEQEGTETPVVSKMPHRVRPSSRRAPYMVPAYATKTLPYKTPEAGYFSMIPEQTQVPMPGRAAACQTYPIPGYVPYMPPGPGTYGLQGAPGCLQIVTPPLNPSAMYSIRWNYGYGASLSMMQSPQWGASNDFSPLPAAQESDGGDTSGSESEGSGCTTSNSGSSEQGTPQHDSLSQGVLGNGFSANTTSQDETSVHVTIGEEDSDNGDTVSAVFAKLSSVSSSSGVTGNPLRVQSYDWEGEKEKIGEGCQEEKFRVSSEDPESSPAPYFICLSCCTPRPSRLGDDGICVYCFEDPTQYCIQGGHEDHKTSFIDTDGRFHEVCNRCRANSDLR